MLIMTSLGDVWKAQVFRFQGFGFAGYRCHANTNVFNIAIFKQPVVAMTLEICNCLEKKL